MLINMIGTDDGDVVDFESWKGETFTDPSGRETLSMVVQAAVASFAVGTPDATEISALSEVSNISSPPAATGASRSDAA